MLCSSDPWVDLESPAWSLEPGTWPVGVERTSGVMIGASGSTGFRLGLLLLLDACPPWLHVEADWVAARSRWPTTSAPKIEIPADDASANIVCAFSVLTHLLDEEVFRYFTEAARVLRSGGVVCYSFNDFSLPYHREKFLRFMTKYEARADVLKWFEKDTRLFVEANGLELIEFLDGKTKRPSQYFHKPWPIGRICYARKP